MAKKSIWNQISNPREEYTDGYGVSRPVYEPGYITVGRKIYNGVDKFLNGPDEINGVPISTGAGSLEFFFDPSSVGKLDDVAKLAKELDNVKDVYRKALLHTKNRQRAFWHEIDAASKGNRVGGLNYAGDLLDALPGTKATNKAAAKYNAAKKAGLTEKANSARKEVEKLSRSDFYDPYVNEGYYREVENILNSPYNGAVLRKIEFPTTPTPVQTPNIELPF